MLPAEQVGKTPFEVLLPPSLAAGGHPGTPVRRVTVPSLRPPLEYHLVTSRTPHPVADDLSGCQLLRVGDGARRIGLGEEGTLSQKVGRGEETQDSLMKDGEQGREGDVGVGLPELLGALSASQGIGQRPDRDVGAGQDGGPVIECPDCALRGWRPRHGGAPSVAGALTRPGVAR